MPGLAFFIPVASSALPAFKDLLVLSFWSLVLGEFAPFAFSSFA